MRRNPFVIPPLVPILAIVTLIIGALLLIHSSKSIQELYWEQTLKRAMQEKWGLRVEQTLVTMAPKGAPLRTCVISYIQPGSLADQRGFKVGDILLNGPKSHESTAMGEGVFYWVLSQAGGWPNPHVRVVNKSAIGDGWPDRARRVYLKDNTGNGS